MPDSSSPVLVCSCCLGVWWLSSRVAVAGAVCRWLCSGRFAGLIQRRAEHVADVAAGVDLPAESPGAVAELVSRGLTEVQVTTAARSRDRGRYEGCVFGGQPGQYVGVVATALRPPRFGRQIGRALRLVQVHDQQAGRPAVRGGLLLRALPDRRILRPGKSPAPDSGRAGCTRGGAAQFSGGVCGCRSRVGRPHAGGYWCLGSNASGS
jgi:hypothetical protein